jgi:hypothetical protein
VIVNHAAPDEPRSQDMTPTFALLAQSIGLDWSGIFLAGRIRTERGHLGIQALAARTLLLGSISVALPNAGG